MEMETLSPVMYTKALGKSLGKVAGEAGRINFVACGVTATTKMRGCYMLVRGIMRLRREDGCRKTRNIGRDIFIYCYNDPIAYIDGDGQEPQRVTIPVVDPIIYISVPVLTVPPPPPPSPPICFPRPPIPIIPLLPTEETPWIGIIRPYPGIDISFPYPDPPGPSDCGLKIGVPIVRHPFGLPGDIRFELEKPPGSPRVTTAKISLAIRF
ncbi:MAG: hypothetical protein BKPUNTRY_002077 [Candidatus Fervidibacter sp.]